MKLTDLTNLFHKVGIYVPGTYGYQEHETAPHVTAIENKLIDLFGGCTTIAGRGGWDANINGVIREQTTIVYAFFPVLTDEIDEEIHSIAEALRNSLMQQCVAVELDGRLYFV